MLPKPMLLTARPQGNGSPLPCPAPSPACLAPLRLCPSYPQPGHHSPPASDSQPLVSREDPVPVSTPPRSLHESSGLRPPSFLGVFAASLLPSPPSVSPVVSFLGPLLTIFFDHISPESTHGLCSLGDCAQQKKTPPFAPSPCGFLCRSPVRCGLASLAPPPISQPDALPAQRAVLLPHWDKAPLLTLRPSRAHSQRSQPAAPAFLPEAAPGQGPTLTLAAFPTPKTAAPGLFPTAPELLTCSGLGFLASSQPSLRCAAQGTPSPPPHLLSSSSPASPGFTSRTSSTSLPNPCPPPPASAPLSLVLKVKDHHPSAAQRHVNTIGRKEVAMIRGRKHVGRGHLQQSTKAVNLRVCVKEYQRKQKLETRRKKSAEIQLPLRRTHHRY